MWLRSWQTRGIRCCTSVRQGLSTNVWEICFVSTLATVETRGTVTAFVAEQRQTSKDKSNCLMDFSFLIIGNLAGGRNRSYRLCIMPQLLEFQSSSTRKRGHL
jgi:hypothetical protein